jgi:hypothetical protein
MLNPRNVKLDLVTAKKLMRLQLRKLESRIDRVVDYQQEDARAAVAGLQRVLGEVALMCRSMKRSFELSGPAGRATATTSAGHVSSTARTARAAGRARSAARSPRGR